jgi:single-stranded DNA-binding protein
MGSRCRGEQAKAPKRRKGSMNSVHLIGRLATDVDVKEVNGGSKVSSFILAVDRTAEEADFAILRQRRCR